MQGCYIGSNHKRLLFKIEDVIEVVPSNKNQVSCKWVFAKIILANVISIYVLDRIVISIFVPLSAYLQIIQQYKPGCPYKPYIL